MYGYASFASISSLFMSFLINDEFEMSHDKQKLG